MSNKHGGRNLALIACLLCGTNLCRGQAVGPTGEVPTTRDALIDAFWTADNNITVASEFKSTKNVVEQEKPVFWTWYTDAGYTSEYNFRGTNLTPNSDGAVFGDARVTKWNFTLGVFGINQLGDASSPSWSVGEGGGAGAGTSAQNQHNSLVPYMRFPTTTQTRFDELDAFISYKLSLGFFDVTLGNIGFFIWRQATNFETDVIPASTGFVWIHPPTFTRFRTVGPNPTVQDETFDRSYITLSTTKLSKYVTPQITYYQTLFSGGSEPEAENFIFYAPDKTGHRPSNPRPNDLRNEALGGYLEGRINGSFPITKWLDFDPYTILSVSFRDRTEPGGTSIEHHPNPNDLRNGSGIYGAHPLTGWNHFQVGIELPIHLVHLGGSSGDSGAPPDAHLYFVPFGNYSYHISKPTPGTDRDEWWGGGKFEVTF
jgi:hypothetical protein